MWKVAMGSGGVKRKVGNMGVNTTLGQEVPTRYEATQYKNRSDVTYDSCNNMETINLMQSKLHREIHGDKSLETDE